uniref:Tyrosine-protein kinase receptor Tie-1-like n=1 Tax=Crassostrea virginica TaxID=6565 RepID=A0A8B8AMU7_CRAVI|nr:tyrosine-protein kinase receptor Tie-1-like [Crassostrea virginica]
MFYLVRHAMYVELLAATLISEGKLESTSQSKSNKTYNTKCQPGYTGQNCDLHCRYPSFGQDCQEDCNCDEKFCDTVNGCNDTAYTLYPITSPVVHFSEPATEKITRNGCRVGYFGNDCKQQCRYPSFGDGCQMMCHCTADHCDHICGCYMTHLKENAYVQRTQYVEKNVCANETNYNVSNTRSNKSSTENTYNSAFVDFYDVFYIVISVCGFTMLLSVIYANSLIKTRTENYGQKDNFLKLS